MKKIIFAFGYGKDNQKDHINYILSQIKNDLSAEQRDSTKVLHLGLDEKSPEEALKEVTAFTTRVWKDVAKEDIIVAYSGENLYLFKYLLPYQNFDLLKLRNSIAQAVSHDECNQKTEMINELFVGGILRLLEVD